MNQLQEKFTRRFFAGSGTAYAADLGGIRESVQMGIHGETDVTIKDESIEYVDKDGNVQEEIGYRPSLDMKAKNMMTEK